MGVDAFAVADEIGELLAHGLQLVEAGLLGVPQRRADHHVGDIEDAQRIGERRVAMQRPADVLGGLGVAVEEHVLPGDQDIVEHHQEVDLVELVGERIVRGRRAARKARARDVLHAGRAHLDDAADRVVGKLLVGPGADRRLQERLVGIARGGLVFGAAHDDAGSVSLTTCTIMSGSCSCGGIERSPLGSVLAETWNTSVSITPLTWRSMLSAKLRIDLVQHVAAVVERPHLADGLVADAGHHAADVVHHGVDGASHLSFQSFCSRGRRLKIEWRLLSLDVGQAGLVARPRAACRTCGRGYRRSA